MLGTWVSWSNTRHSSVAIRLKDREKKKTLPMQLALGRQNSAGRQDEIAELRIQRGRADCEIGNTISICKHTLPSDHPCTDGRQTRSAPPRMAHSPTAVYYYHLSLIK
ncbi:unnamed protein product [Macrosiphum euphorbiae]|uniref:Uncharacterized protein n=1 Tax=Macrosiphum euphorbiae TaxID=13131 RepID=A0AAV0VQS6_9HEMI|nr:unnamed protein product [Macrosiphum euphorbiae]